MRGCVPFKINMMADKKEYNFTFFQDLLKEKRGGKYSSKKIWGAITMLLLCLAFVGDGFKFYQVNVELFNTFAIIATTLIGLGSLAAIFSKSEPEQLAPSDEEQN
jgi:hypothetical protein